VGVLRHYVKHSPTGFSWGYGGSGPADLARCLLIDALGKWALCAECAGTGRQVYDEAAGAFVPFDPDADYSPGEAETVGQCVDCYGTRFTAAVESNYQRFKFDVVAGLPQAGEWELSRDEIVGWLVERSRS
jgi:hypothetical protein